MPRKFFHRLSAQYWKKDGYPWFLKPFAYIASHPVYFAVTRRTVCGALWIGLFVGFLPIPGQTVVAVLLALWLRVNLPIAAITIWVSNPVTFVPIFYLAYRIGAVLLNIPVEQLPADISWAWLSEEVALRWRPLFYGSLLMGLSISSTAYLVVSALWHILTIRRYRQRHIRTIGSIRGGKPERVQRD